MTRPVPHGWKEVALSDVSNAHSGGTPSRDEPDFWNDGIPWMKIEDITKSGKYLSTTIETISDLGLQKSAAKLFPVGTVFLAMYASVGELCISKIETSCNQAILGFSNLKNIQRDYLYYYLLSLKEAWKRDIQTGSQPNLNKGLVLGRTILLPTLPEQEGIAAVLGSVDATIDATKQVIAQTRQLKRAVMQTLLTRGLPGQHTQFKPSPLGTLPADWEVVKLGSCVEFGPQNGLYKHASHYGSGTYIVRIDDFQNGRFIRSRLRKKSGGFK
jgi:type I restriction enzyme S subunit